MQSFRASLLLALGLAAAIRLAEEAKQIQREEDEAGQGRDPQ